MLPPDPCSGIFKRLLTHLLHARDRSRITSALQADHAPFHSLLLNHSIAEAALNGSS
jgi:hypothetical protein